MLNRIGDDAHESVVHRIPAHRVAVHDHDNEDTLLPELPHLILHAVAQHVQCLRGYHDEHIRDLVARATLLYELASANTRERRRKVPQHVVESRLRVDGVQQVLLVAVVGHRDGRLARVGDRRQADASLLRADVQFRHDGPDKVDGPLKVCLCARV